VIEPLHTQAMRRAMADAGNNGGWLETPELPIDYGYVTGAHAPSWPPREMAAAIPALAGLRTWVDRTPDRIACADARNSLSYLRLWREAARLAKTIRDAPASSEPVAILLPGDVRWPVAVYACLAANRVAVALDTQFPDDRNDSMIRQVGASLVIAPAASTALLTDRLGLPIISMEIDQDPGEMEFPPESHWLGQDQPAWIVATSGSTGQPKAVVHSQRSLLYKVCGWRTRCTWGTATGSSHCPPRNHHRPDQHAGARARYHPGADGTGDRRLRWLDENAAEPVRHHTAGECVHPARYRGPS